MAPRWSLKQVKTLAASDALLLSRAKAAAHFSSEAVAYATAKQVIAALSALDFSHTTQQADECDVYGVSIGGAGYYLKVTVVDGPRLIVVSLHPLDKPLKTKKGELKP